MTIALDRLIDQVPNLDEVAAKLELTLKDTYEENDPELKKILAYQPQETVTRKQKSKSLKRQEQAQQGKGELTQAGEKLTNAIAKTQVKQAVEACDSAARITAVAVLKRNSSNMTALADQILQSAGMSSEIVDRTSDAFDLDAFLEEIDSPLAE